MKEFVPYMAYLPWISIAFVLLVASYLFLVVKNKLQSNPRMLIDDSPTKSILYFTLPMFASLLLQQLYVTVDYLIVGQFLGSKGIAAMGLSITIYMLVVAFALNLTAGASIVIARYFGARQYDMIKEGISTIFIAILVFGILLSTVSIFLIEEILRMLQTPDEIMEEAKTYMTFLFMGFPILFLFNTVSAIFRGVGDSLSPLFYLLVTSALNIILAVVFIIFLNSGIAGAAFASVISQLVALIMAVHYMLRPENSHLHFNIFKPVFNVKFFKETFNIGFPMGVQQSIASLAFLFINKSVNMFGLSAATAYAAIGRIDPLVTLPALCFSSAIATYISQNLGAKRIDRLKLGVYATLKMLFIYSIIIAPLVFIFRRSIAEVLLPNTDIETINLVADWFFINGFGYIMLNIVWVYHGAMRGFGKSYLPFMLSAVSLWIIRVPLNEYLSHIWGINGVWASATITWAIHLVLTLVLWYSPYWQKTKNKIIEENVSS